MFTCEEIWCQLFSEPGAGSDLAALSTTAVQEGDTWIVNGQKVWTTLAHLAKWGLLVARTDPDVSKHAGLTYFLVDMEASRASTSGRCTRSPERRSSTRSTSTTCASPTTSASVRSAKGGPSR
jgi:alkylation response protein AidB-like acyl-CoA dehydrogenase